MEVGYKTTYPDRKTDTWKDKHSELGSFSRFFISLLCCALDTGGDGAERKGTDSGPIHQVHLAWLVHGV